MTSQIDAIDDTLDDPRATPPRRRGSIRRTSSMEMEFPQGRDGPVVIAGRARDAWTADPTIPPAILADDRLSVCVGPDKVIRSFDSDPPLSSPDALVGHNAIAGFRNRLRPLLVAGNLEERPLALLLDDMVGSNIISGWIWTKWMMDRTELIQWVGDPRPMENACIGYRSGASGLTSHDYFDKLDFVPPMGRIDDSDAFHPLQPDRDRTMRRVRRIDVWHDNTAIAIDAMFQDSGVVPGGRRSAVHEYRVHARADAESGILTAIDAMPGALPHPECLGAPSSVAALIGQPLADIRAQALIVLRGPVGCTHLTDAARALAEVPSLAAMLL